MTKTQEMMDKYVNIVLASDGNYAQHACVAMTSALLNTKEPARLKFFLIDDNIDEKNKELCLKTIEKNGGSLSFVKANEEALKNVFVSGSLTRAAYFRLDIPNILPGDIDRVIYMDCDLLVLGEITELWNIDMQSKPVAAAEDYGILSSKGKRAEKTKNFDWKEEDSYFNSGVLLIDVKQWREKGYAGKLIKLVDERNFRHHDQDALNYMFMDKWAKLPLRWNVIPPVFNMMPRIAFNSEMRKKAVEALQNVGIFHYAGGYKPWEYTIHEGFNEKYYEYLAHTEYKNVKMPQPNLKKKGHSINRQMWRLKWARLVQKFF